MLRRLAATLALLVGGAVGSPAAARAEEAPRAQPGDLITWVDGIARAFAVAKDSGRIVMICINSSKVDGGRKEPAAEGLREVVYKDPRIVGRSRDFVCVFLGATAAGDDFGELKVRFGIDGMVVSPQHIFARPDHETGAPLVRLEYWPYGRDDDAVKALLGLMDKATERYKAEGGTPPPSTGTPDATAPEAGGTAPDAPVAPAGTEERAAWIAQLILMVRDGPTPRRMEAIRTLLVNDQGGDTITPLTALLLDPECGKNLPLLKDLIRGLGRPGLKAAVPGISEHLGHKEALVRANAAVSLEYIGDPEALDELLKQVKRERDPMAESHMYRAIGRCGVGDSKVRTLLLKAAGGGKEEVDSFGPLIGLAHFEGDAKAARGVDKLAGKLGPPSFGRRGGGGQGTAERMVLMWCLARIGDPKSAEFVQERMLDPIRNVKSPWIRRTRDFYEAVIRTCRGEKEALGEVEGGVQFVLNMGMGNPLQDEARKGREDAGYTPLFDWEIRGGAGPGGMDPDGGDGN
jgi:hypothetical protein